MELRLVSKIDENHLRLRPEYHLCDLGDPDGHHKKELTNREQYQIYLLAKTKTCSWGQKPLWLLYLMIVYFLA